MAVKVNVDVYNIVGDKVNVPGTTGNEVKIPKAPGVPRFDGEEVKKVARQVLERLQSLLALDWRRQTQARAQVRLAIEDTLDTGLPRPYTKELYRGKCSALFEHVFESYQGEGVSIYAGAA